MLVLYSGAGGLCVGYAKAGFQVVGVDIEYQPAYPYQQITADVTTPGLIADLVAHYNPVAVSASPPCQRYSRLLHYQPKVIEQRYPDLIGWTRTALDATGLPWVIENVEMARPLLRDPIMLCGTMFPELEVIRHRLFEVSGFDAVVPHHIAPAAHPRVTRNGYLPTPERPFMTISGGKHSRAWQKRACQAMGTQWMTTIREVCESVPPAYSEFLGAQLMAQLQVAAA